MSRLFILFSLICFTVIAKDPYPKNDNIDIKHYRFQLELNDSTDVIAGEATVSLLFKKSITSNGKTISFSHQNNKINLKLNSAPATGEQVAFVISYSGTPEDGLIIG